MLIIPTYKVIKDGFWYGEFLSFGDTFETEEYIYADGVELIDDLPATRVVLANFAGSLTAGSTQELIINWSENEIGTLFLAVDGEIKLYYNGNETAQFKNCNIVHRISADMVRKVVIEAVTDSNVWFTVLREAR